MDSGHLLSRVVKFPTVLFICTRFAWLCVVLVIAVQSKIFFIGIKNVAEKKTERYTQRCLVYSPISLFIGFSCLIFWKT